MNEAIALHVVDVFSQNGGAYFFQFGRVHLAVSGHHGGAVDVVIETPFISPGDGCAHAAVF